ncbi:unnamed protein product [Symbiodinium necroappetens]|uniref:Uncharacterized protein n=1 Tax=Symbiodinium necroappetens TaxID=1628268 RepID=A0A813BPS5_9DINO|nr:unnamed protein product [Symbiodinium necroappetens]
MDMQRYKTGRRRCAGVALTLAACLALGNNAFLEAAGKPTGRPIGDGRHHSRRRLFELGAGALLFPAEGAHALGVAFDYRTLDEIQEPTRKPVGDVTSEKAQKAIGLIKECREKIKSLLTKFTANPEVDFTPYFEPQPDKIRAALDDIYDLLDQDTRPDAERVGRIMLAARYNIIGASSGVNNMKPDINRLVPEEQVKYNNKMVDFLRAADRLLKYVS